MASPEGKVTCTSRSARSIRRVTRGARSTIARPSTGPHSCCAVAARVRSCDSAAATAASSVWTLPSTVSSWAPATTVGPRLLARRRAPAETSARAFAVRKAATAPA